MAEKNYTIQVHVEISAPHNWCTARSTLTEVWDFGTQLVYILFSSNRISPRGVDGVADGDDVSRSGNIQVRPREGDEARVSHSVLVPT